MDETPDRGHRIMEDVYRRALVALMDRLALRKPAESGHSGPASLRPIDLDADDPPADSVAQNQRANLLQGHKQ